MSSIKFLLFLFLFLGVSAPAILSQTPEIKTVKVVRNPVERVFNPDFMGKPEAEIERLEHSLSDAVRSKDSEALDNLLSETVLIAGLIGTKSQFISLLKAQDTKYYAIEKSEMRIKLYGDTAVTTGIQKADIDIENGSKMSQTIFINTWKLIDGKWHCIAFAN